MLKKINLIVILCLFTLVGFSYANDGKDIVVTGQYLMMDEGENGWGLGVYSFKDKKFSWYANFQISLDRVNNNTYYYDFISQSTFNDPVSDEITSGCVFNVGITRNLYKFIGVYAGLGYATVVDYLELYDSYHILAPDGHYYVDDGDSSGLNCNAGVMLFIKRVTVELGYNTFISSPYLGFGIKF